MYLWGKLDDSKYGGTFLFLIQYVYTHILIRRFGK